MYVLPKSLLRSLVLWALDRPGGRSLLQWWVNAYADRLNHGPALRVYYDREVQAWGRVADDEHVIDGRSFAYRTNQLQMASGDTPWTAAAKRLWLARLELQPGDTVLDIGAEVGSDLPAFAKAVGADGMVLAVEAHPDTYKLLERTVQQCGYDQVKTVNVAVMGEPGEVFIADAAVTLENTVSTANEHGHRVSAVTVDDLCRRYNIATIKLLKVNIEGSEKFIFDGMKDALRRTHHIYIACHDFRADAGDGEFYRTREFVVASLRDLGFQVAEPSVGVPPYVRDHVYARRPGADEDVATHASSVANRSFAAE